MQGVVQAVSQLWHDHAVALKTRARFWAGFHAREDFFFRTELRRLRHMDERLRQVSIGWCSLLGCCLQHVG